MEIIQNANHKTICRADVKNKSIEIVHKGFKTIIRFLDNGKMEIINFKIAQFKI